MNSQIPTVPERNCFLKFSSSYVAVNNRQFMLMLKVETKNFYFADHLILKFFKYKNFPETQPISMDFFEYLWYISSEENYYEVNLELNTIIHEVL